MKDQGTSKRQRLAFVATLVVFISLTAWWCCYFPYAPERLYRAIPANATFVSEHDALDERWREIAQSPITVSLLTFCGVPPEDIDATVADPWVEAAVNRIGKRRTVIAHVPSLSAPHEEAWVLAAWAGGHSQLLRWGLLSGSMKNMGFERHRTTSGHGVWIRRYSSDSADAFLSVAATEGVLLACWSTNPFGVGYLLDRVEYVAHMHPELVGRDTASTALDRGWLKLPRPVGPLTSSRIDFEITSYSSTGASGLLTGRGLPQVSSTLAGAEAFDELRDLLGAAPNTLVVLPRAALEMQPMRKGTPEGWAHVREILETAARKDALVFLAMCGGEYKGKLFVGVPSFMVGFKLVDDADVQQILSAALDELNRKYHWGLVAGPPSESDGVVSITITKVDRKDKLHTVQPMGCVRKGDWMLISSNRRALGKLIQTHQGERIHWFPGEDLDGMSGYAWADIPAVERDLRDVLNAYILYLMASGSPRYYRDREKAESILRCVDGLRPMGTCAVRLRSEADQATLHIEIGARARSDDIN